MRLNRVEVLVVAGLWLAGISATGLGQEKPATGKPESATPADKPAAKGTTTDAPAASKDGGVAAAKPAPSATGQAGPKPRTPEPWESEVGERVWMRIKALNRLEASVFERVQLSADERKAVSTKIESIRERMIEDPNRAARRPIARELHSSEKAAELNQKIADAEKAGDPDRAAFLKNELLEGTAGENENTYTPFDELLDEVRPVIPAEKQAAYDAVLDRWREIEVRAPFDGPVRMAQRAARDPDLKLTAEQRKQIEEAIVQVMKSLPPGERSEKTKTEAGAKAQSTVLAVLQDNQKSIYQKNIADFEHQFEELKEYKLRTLQYGKIGRNAESKSRAAQDQPKTDNKD